jgi:hypothetical protein
MKRKTESVEASLLATLPVLNERMHHEEQTEEASLALFHRRRVEHPERGSLRAGGITTRCTNGGGNTPNGQYNGQGLTRQNANPHGFAPPGQNR